ncbi:lysine--tRNA ligase [Dactylosporangium fulvum]|uniref:Lysine--tRNA ligase n=1 Tax=Dactylosporangium fulvum TaxID=53359 RepID=A0ABY5VLV6_9ACTN|nr:lysine--tRNA ligase [Dactylosporangium fulvum]UWP78577.1 lysine--tRNA ligase [Dactylosporangium fulvum]
MTRSIEDDWVARFADEVIAAARERAPGRPIVCASGLSPSGPIHLGNLREVMTPHLVADEIRRRGHDCVHLLSWDDYDRFRKVPAGVEGVDESWAEHVGRPLTAVPAPRGSAHPNWAEHFKAAMAASLAQLGVRYRGISQTRMYTGGAYTDRILLAMRERAHIDGVLAKYRTKLTPEEAGDDGEGAAGYYPYRPYCSVCGRDTTTVTAYDDTTTALAYTCACGHRETVLLSEHRGGKLVWKVDWPMRWAFEGVQFEPSGVDHTSPGSSFVVGGQLVTEVFGGWPPIGPMYAFVGIAGMAKMSSSRGGVPTPADALRIMEPPLLRWLYSRRRPNQSFKIAFDDEIQRLYDEWDTLGRRVAGGSAAPADAAAYHRAVGTADGPLPATPRPLPYRMLASVADITVGDPVQMLRILAEADPSAPVTSLDEVRPRLDRALHWVTEQVPPDQRTHVRTAPDAELLASLPAAERDALRLLAAGLEEHWSLEGLTTLVYGVPKLRLGLPLDTKPTPELKAAQRAFFSLLYRLLVGRESGPRLPTLLLAVGAGRVRTLLGAGSAGAGQ